MSSPPAEQPPSSAHASPSHDAEAKLGHTRASARAVLVLIALHAALTAWLAFARFTTIHNHTFDLALYARLAWGLVHAQLWDPVAGGHFLGGHIPWVLAPLGAAGLVFGIVPVLLVVQSACVALAAWPLSLAGARRFGPLGGVAAALAYLLYPNLGHVASYEFHPGTLALLPLAVALELLDRQRGPALGAVPQRGLLTACALAVACRASLALQTALLGLLALLGKPALRRPGKRIALGSLVYFALSLLVLQPLLGQGVAASMDIHYGQWGGSPLGVLSTLLSAPGRVIEHFAAPERLSYLPRVLAPLLLLPLAAPGYLAVALPPIALNLLSQFPDSSELSSHYLTTAVPALVMAAMAGLHRIAARARRLAPLALVPPALAASALAGGLPWSRDFEAAAFRADAATRARSAVLARIPEGASVQAPDPLLPHLAERRRVHRVPPPERATDFVVLEVAHRARFAHDETLLRTFEEPLVRRWLARRDHRVVLAVGDLIVLRRGQSPRGGLARRYFAGIAPTSAGRALCACLAVRAAELQGDSLTLEFVANSACPDDLALRLGADIRPERVDLLFDGLLSPANLSRGDIVRSTHELSASERRSIMRHGLQVGALRSSGARPDPSDPHSVPVQVRIVDRPADPD